MVYFKRAEFWHRTPSDDKLTEPLREVAEYLKVKDRTIYRVVAKREIPGFEVGGSWRFRKSEINQLVKDVQSEGPEGDICLFREVNGGALAVEHAHAGDKLVLYQSYWARCSGCESCVFKRMSSLTFVRSAAASLDAPCSTARDITSALVSPRFAPRNGLTIK